MRHCFVTIIIVLATDLTLTHADNNARGCFCNLVYKRNHSKIGTPLIITGYYKSWCMEVTEPDHCKCDKWLHVVRHVSTHAHAKGSAAVVLLCLQKVDKIYTFVIDFREALNTKKGFTVRWREKYMRPYKIHVTYTVDMCSMSKCYKIKIL